MIWGRDLRPTSTSGTSAFRFTKGPRLSPRRIPKGGVTLFPIERDEVGDVRGKSLLHLQCHFGLGTLSWARRGGSVTGLDFSDQGIGLARKIAAELDLPARFVCSDIYAAKSVIAEKFAIVFTSYGVLCWLPDLKKWAEIPAHFHQAGWIFIHR